jgi:hypothetical protein
MEILCAEGAQEILDGAIDLLRLFGAGQVAR